eukprot:1624773-Amphidinium_carterae.1
MTTSLERASKILDFHSLKKGNIAMASDAEMAYIQATLQGIHSTRHQDVGEITQGPVASCVAKDA